MTPTQRTSMASNLFDDRGFAAIRVPDRRLRRGARSPTAQAGGAIR